MRAHRFFTRSAVASALAVATLAMAQGAPGLDRSAAQVSRAEAGQALAVAATPAAAVNAFLRSRGKSDAVLASLNVSRSSRGAHGVTHLRMEQTVDGLAVHGAYLKAAVNARGELVHVVDRLAAVSVPRAAQVDARAALTAAMARVHPAQAVTFRAASVQGHTARFDGGAFFHSPPEVTAVAIPMGDGSLARGWLVETWTRKTNRLHHTLVGGDGRVLDVELRTASDSYYVFTEDPLKTPQAVVSGPGAGNDASPAGWLAGRTQLSTKINGNNVLAYLDTDDNDRADRGGTAVTDSNFLALADLGASPTTTGNRAVAVQNLFYLNNVIHDVLYRKGFDEAAGNFQQTNFVSGGKPRDPVQAEAHDGGGTDNANFATPPDGRKPRMQMYLWTGAGGTHEVAVAGGSTYAAMGAEFGPALSTTGVSGQVVLANDGTGTTSDACEAVSSAVAGRLALVDRGTCAFTVKALNVQAAGAIGMIVANNTGGTDIFPMGGTDASIAIGAVMISQNDGAALRGLSAPSATMRLKAVQPLQIDASLDSDVVFHEYGHGLTWRMIGGMSGPLAGAIGEGMSDGLAMLVNGDDRIGEYSASSPIGIRSAPYTNYTRTYGNVAGTGVHFDGEVYAAIIWRLIQDFDAASRREDLFRYVIDGMNYTPSTPAYEHMRDGILASVAAAGASATDGCTVWRAFAAYGVGVGAQGVVNANGTVTITPSTAVPASCP